jgi:hypothetical protein
MTKDDITIPKRRDTDSIWAQAAIAAREDDDEDSAGSKSYAKEDRYAHADFPKYDASKVVATLKNAAGQDAKNSLQMHTPQCKYTASDVGTVIKVPSEKQGLEARLAYIVCVDLKNDVGRIYVLTQRKSKLEKETCWFYKKPQKPQ